MKGVMRSNGVGQRGMVVVDGGSAVMYRRIARRRFS